MAVAASSAAAAGERQRLDGVEWTSSVVQAQTAARRNTPTCTTTFVHIYIYFCMSTVVVHSQLLNCWSKVIIMMTIHTGTYYNITLLEYVLECAGALETKSQSRHVI